MFSLKKNPQQELFLDSTAAPFQRLSVWGRANTRGKALTASLTVNPLWPCPLMIYFSRGNVFTKGYNWCVKILIKDIFKAWEEVGRLTFTRTERVESLGVDHFLWTNIMFKHWATCIHGTYTHPYAVPWIPAFQKYGWWDSDCDWLLCRRIFQRSPSIAPGTFVTSHWTYILCQIAASLWTESSTSVWISHISEYEYSHELQTWNAVKNKLQHLHWKWKQQLQPCIFEVQMWWHMWPGARSTTVSFS